MILCQIYHNWKKNECCLRIAALVCWRVSSSSRPFLQSCLTSKIPDLTTSPQTHWPSICNKSLHLNLSLSSWFCFSETSRIEAQRNLKLSNKNGRHNIVPSDTMRVKHTNSKWLASVFSPHLYFHDDDFWNYYILSLTFAKQCNSDTLHKIPPICNIILIMKTVLVILANVSWVLKTYHTLS